MKANEYQEGTARTAMYPDKGGMGGLTYAVLGLASEAGEVAGKLKKVMRDNGGKLEGPARLKIAEELGDCAWYIAQTATELGFTLEEIMKANLDKLASRAERGVIQGSGDSR